MRLRSAAPFLNLDIGIPLVAQQPRRVDQPDGSIRHTEVRLNATWSIELVTSVVGLIVLLVVDRFAKQMGQPGAL